MLGWRWLWPFVWSYRRWVEKRRLIKGIQEEVNPYRDLGLSSAKLVFRIVAPSSLLLRRCSFKPHRILGLFNHVMLRMCPATRSPSNLQSPANYRLPPPQLYRKKQSPEWRGSYDQPTTTYLVTTAPKDGQCRKRSWFRQWPLDKRC